MYRDAASSVLVTAFTGKVFGIDRTTGEIRWKVELDKFSVVELAITEQVVIALAGRLLVFIEYPSGTVRKRIERTDEAASSAGRPVLLVAGDHLFIGNDYGQLACYTLDGAVVWAQPFKGEGYGEVALGFPGHVRQADDQ